MKEYLKASGEFFVFTGEECRVYIPEEYFEKRLAEDFGSSLMVLGLLDVALFKGDKMVSKHTLNLPTMITMYPTEMDKEELSIVEGVTDRYRVAKFFNGDQFTKRFIAQDSTNVEKFLKLMMGGKLPRTVPYGKVLEIWQKNLEINGVRLGVPSTILEIIIREIYRDASTPELPFAMKIGNDKSTSEHAYRPANIREICARNSTFAALTFEDMDQMITSSLNINRYNKQQSVSPIEKLIKM